MPSARVWVALAVAIAPTACDEPVAETTRVELPTAVYPGAAGAWPAAAAGSRFGRGVAPQLATRRAIVGAQHEPLTRARVIAVGGDGEPLAVIEGSLGNGEPAIDLIEIDGGRVRWRDSACRGSVRRADRTAIVCTGPDGTAAVDLAGHLRWKDPRRLAAVDAAGALVIAGDHELVSIDLASGTAGEPIALPATVAAADIRARCGDELWAANADGRLQRIVRAPATAPRPARPGRRRAPAPPPRPVGLAPAWTVMVGEVRGIDPCDPVVVIATAPVPPAPARRVAPTAAAPVTPARAPARRPPPRRPIRRRRPPPVVATPPPSPGWPTPPPMALVDPAPAIMLVAIDHASGRVVGGPIAARGYWPARDGSPELEIATAAGIEQRPRTLARGRVVDGSPVLGALLDRRGDRRLVAGPAGSTTLYVLDRRGVRTVVAAPAGSGALGDDAIVVADHQSGPVLLAPPAARADRLGSPPTPPAGPPAHRLELAAARTADLSAAIPFADAPADDIVAIAIDPTDPAVIWAVTRYGPPSPTGRAAIARLDLRARRWDLLSLDGCPVGVVVGIVITRDVVVCAVAGAVNAIHRDGTPAWGWSDPRPAAAIDGIAAAGRTVAVRSGDRAIVLDAITGAIRDDRASDDGLAARILPVTLGGAAAVIDLERGVITARAIAAPLAPLWAAAPRGAVTGLSATADDLIVILDATDAYRLELATGDARPLAVAAERWSIAGDLVIGELGLDDGFAVRVFDRGGERFRAAVAAVGPFAIASRAADPHATLALVHGAPPEVILLDPATGALMNHVALGERASPGAVFTTVVDGQPVAGAVLFGPLAAVIL